MIRAAGDPDVEAMAHVLRYGPAQCVNGTHNTSRVAERVRLSRMERPPLRGKVKSRIALCLGAGAGGCRRAG